MTEQTQQKFENWCLVELFGHQQIAGWVTEATIGGCALVRVDVPAINDRHAVYVMDHFLNPSTRGSFTNV